MGGGGLVQCQKTLGARIAAGHPSQARSPEPALSDERAAALAPRVGSGGCPAVLDRRAGQSAVGPSTAGQIGESTAAGGQGADALGGLAAGDRGLDWATHPAWLVSDANLAAARGGL